MQGPVCSIRSKLNMEIYMSGPVCSIRSLLNLDICMSGPVCSIRSKLNLEMCMSGPVCSILSENPSLRWSGLTPPIRFTIHLIIAHLLRTCNQLNLTLHAYTLFHAHCRRIPNVVLDISKQTEYTIFTIFKTIYENWITLISNNWMGQFKI